MRSPGKREEEYTEFYRVMRYVLDHRDILMELEEALMGVSRLAHLLALEVGILERVSDCEGLANTDPRISRSYGNLLVRLKYLGKACAPINAELPGLKPPAEHRLDADDLIEGAVQCGVNGHWIGRLLNESGLRKPRRECQSKVFLYSIMVQGGKYLQVGYDVQVRLLAPHVFPHYGHLPKEAQERKKRTLERDLKNAFKEGREGEIATLMPLLLTTYRVLQRLGELDGPIRWVLEGFPLDPIEDPE